MEEWVGQLWHKVITRAARRDYPQAAVRLEEIRRPAAIMFRALGGDGGLRIEAANETESTARRKLLSRIAGTGKQVALAWRDNDTLRLPASIAWLPSAISIVSCTCGWRRWRHRRMQAVTGCNRMPPQRRSC